MTIGEKIKALREERQLTQEQLGRLCGTTKQTIFKYENNVVTNIPLNRLEKISDILGVTPAYLMGWDTSNTTDIVITNNIKKYRESWGFSKQQLADFIGVDISTIDAWESGISFPSVGYVEKLCKAFCISEDALKSIPAEAQFKHHEEDYLFDLFCTCGFSVFYATVADKTSVMAADSNNIYELSMGEFEDFKQSIRDFVKYKLYDTIKSRNPVVNISKNLPPKEG